jgi:hypothetical protein
VNKRFSTRLRQYDSGQLSGNPEIERHLTTRDPEELRSSSALRESVADEADAILKHMQGAFA